MLDLVIENLSKEPLRIVSVVSNNLAYQIVNDVPEVIPPGQSGRLHVSYGAQENATGASLDLMLSATLTASPIIRVPLQIKLPKQSAAPTITQEMRRLAEEEFKKGQNAPR